MGIYKIELNVRKTPASPTMNLNYVNFLACLYFASDWFRNNQLLSQLTHAQYRCTVPLNSCKGLSLYDRVFPNSLIAVLHYLRVLQPSTIDKFNSF